MVSERCRTEVYDLLDGILAYSHNGARLCVQDVGDVELPSWAATAEEFIRVNRAALESDYVSTHL
jgi:hypothetical protein